MPAILGNVAAVGVFISLRRMSAFVLYRQAGGLVLLGLCVLMFEPRPLLHKPLGLKGMLLLAAQGFTGMFMGQGFFVLGLGHTNPVVAVRILLGIVCTPASSKCGSFHLISVLM